MSFPVPHPRSTTRIPGDGGLSGPIMSHDFVEAALMRRAGYHVWLVSDLEGSYEQQPPDLLSELQRFIQDVGIAREAYLKRVALYRESGIA